MKNILYALMILLLAAAAPAQDAGTVQVSGDRVSLRAEPKTDAVLLGRAMKGDGFVLKDNSHPEWVGAAAPDSTDCWVHSDYVRDGKVVPDLLNVRSGPSLSHSTIGVLSKGTPVTVRGQVGEWLRIAPPPEVTVWISRRYAEVVPPPAPPAPAADEAAAPVAEEPAPSVPANDAGPAADRPVAIKEIITAMEAASPLPEVLRQDPGKPQGVPDAFSGILLPAGSALYKLADADVNAIIHCYVRGNRAQMEACAGRRLRLSGKTYWAEGLDTPVIVPSRIEVFAD